MGGTKFGYPCHFIGWQNTMEITELDQVNELQPNPT